MSILQAWLVIGIPSLALAVLLFLDRSPVRSALGYVVLIAGFAGLALTDRVSAAVFGGLLALAYAAGRGGALERETPVVRRTFREQESADDAPEQPARSGTAANP